MTPHIQQAEQAESITAHQSAPFVTLETAAPSLTGIIVANDNTSQRPNILVKRRRRRARMAAR